MSSATDAPCLPVLPSAQSCRRQRWLCATVWIIGLLVIFGAGAVSGAAGYSYWHHSLLVWFSEHPEEIPDMIVEKLQSDLSLTPEQLPRVAETVRRNHAELEAIQDDIRPRINERCAAYEEEMHELLTPAQYDRWLPHFREVRKIWLP